MSEQAMDQTGVDGFTYEASDESLEAAGGVKEKVGVSPTHATVDYDVHTGGCCR